MTQSPRTYDRREFLALAGAAAGAAALAPLAPAMAARPGGHRARAATAWFDLALRLVRDTPGFSPPVASRAFGYMGVTLYEAIVPGMPSRRSLAGTLPGLGWTPAGRSDHHWPTVANAALAAIARDLFPTMPDELRAQVRALERSLARRYRRKLTPERFRRSKRRGRRVAEVIFEWSKSDGGHEGYARNFPAHYSPPVGPGLWAPTPPGFQRALQPFWGQNRPFAIASGAACDPGPHTPYSTDPSSAFYAEALEVLDAVNDLTSEQEAIARFWSDDPGETATPPGHSISITTQLLRRERASLGFAAEAYAKIGMAIADAFIACWHTKYATNLLRPITYIHQEIDHTWTPPLATPPFPEYTSGHSVQSGAAFSVMESLFGDVAFTDHTHDDRGLAPRSFPSCAAAAQEAAISRLYGGIHYRPAIDLGVAQGRCVGAAVAALPLRA